jgi:site-specific DNA recombinase
METKSGKFSYYVCGTLDKKGSGSCQAKYINTERFESQMSDRIVELADLESIAECVGDLRGLLKEGST